MKLKYCMVYCYYYINQNLARAAVFKDSSQTALTLWDIFFYLTLEKHLPNSLNFIVAIIMGAESLFLFVN